MPAPVTSRRIRSAARPAPRAPAAPETLDDLIAARGDRRALDLARHIIAREIRVADALIFALALAAPLALMLAVL